MHITVSPLCPELSDDYFDFFESRAFTDDSPYRCYCQVYQMTQSQYHAAFDGADGRDLGALSRAAAARQIASGALRGYLAYADGIAIGWCNVNDRAAFPADGVAAHFHADAEAREKAVVCFEIAPAFRGKGVATALLRRAVEDAAAEGYRAVAAFPVPRAERFEWDSPGPVRLFEKEGFVKTGGGDGFIEMRKEL